MRSIILILTLISMTFAITPPKEGNFPAKLTKILKQNPEFIQYGDPGWIKKMQTLKFSGNALAKTSSLVTFNLPVLLGSFNDVEGTKSSSTFQDHLFDNNPSGTMTEYYSEVSYGDFNLTGTVYGWYTADQNKSSYMGDGNGFGGTFPGNAKGYVYNIVSKADGTVDFSQFDNDGPDGNPNSGDDDGYVDAVCVVFPKAGGELSVANALWSHMSSLGSNEFITNDISANGGNIKVSSYLICSEENSTGGIRDIGVYTHEFGHALGLPDLYDTTDDTQGPDFEDSEGIGEWCLMASGSYGGDGSHEETPAHMSAWCKIQLGWLTPTIINSAVKGQSIKQSETNAEAYIIWEDPYSWSRYFLVENRQKVGFDQYLNGDGLLIYHIDENRSWGKSYLKIGYINNDETHKLVDIEEADGFANLDNNENRGDAGDPYPGSTGNTSFTNTSSPSSDDYDNLETGVAITNISAPSSTMTADIVPRQVLGYVTHYDEMGITGALSFPDPQDIWGGTQFTTGDAGDLTAVDLGFFKGDVDYVLSVFGSFASNKPSNLLASKSGHIDSDGWHTVLLNSPVGLAAGQSFFVTVKVFNILTVDSQGPVSGSSFYSADGINYFSLNGDVNIRVRIQTGSITTIKEPDNNIETFSLKQNYPNPFNPRTKINYQLPENSNVQLSVYNLLGQKIATLVNKEQSAGRYSVEWDAAKFGSGVYIYTLAAGKFTETKKMILIK